MSSLPPLDPRPKPSDAAPPLDSAGEPRPSIASARPRFGTAAIVTAAVALGAVTFAAMSAGRAPPKPSTALAPTSAVAPPPAPPSDLVATEAAARTGAAPLAPGSATAVMIPTPTSMSATTPLPATPPPMVLPANSMVRPLGLAQADGSAVAGRRSPALVVDLGEGGGGAVATPGSVSGAPAGAAPVSIQAAGAARPALNADEQFAQRVGDVAPETARATVIRNTRQTIPQGAMIPGVLETALNSDLPGFARAVVSRDVRGFDGTQVLIPRGSRVIGQYKSAASQGQSRAFVIWTRVIRPDGASIQIGSSGTDPLGRAGLEGTVDRHFFERFGGSILLSVINAGVASLARAPSTQVVIGSSAEATSLAAGAAPQTISPTIKVLQGAPIRIFVARDLDFSPVGPAK